MSMDFTEPHARFAKPSSYRYGSCDQPLREYMRAIKDWYNKKAEGDGEKQTNFPPPPVTGSLRKLTVLCCLDAVRAV